MKIEKKKIFSYKKNFRKKILIKKFPSSLLIGEMVWAASTPSFRMSSMGVFNNTPFCNSHNGAATTVLIRSHVRNRNRNAVRKTKT